MAFWGTIGILGCPPLSKLHTNVSRLRADAVYKRSLVRAVGWGLSCSEIEKSSIEADSLAARGREQGDPPAGSARTRRADFRDRDLVAHRVTPPRAPRLLAAATTLRASPAARGESGGSKAREGVQRRRRGGPRRRDVAHSAVITGERLSHHRMSHRRCPAQEQDTLSGATDAPPNKRLRRPPATPA